MCSKPGPLVVSNAGTAEYWFREGCGIAEWWNRPDDPDLSVARARVPAGGVTRWHRLRGVTERYVMLEGRGRVELGGGIVRTVAPGDVVLIPPGEAQRIRNEGEGDLVFLALCTPRFSAALYEELTSKDDVPPPDHGVG